MCVSCRFLNNLSCFVENVAEIKTSKLTILSGVGTAEISTANIQTEPTARWNLCVMFVSVHYEFSMASVAHLSMFF